MTDIPTAVVPLSQGRLTIDFISFSNNIIELDVALHLERSYLVCLFETPSSLHSKFVQDLKAMHRDLAGEARLDHYFNGSWLRFELLSRAKGTIKVSADLGIEVAGFGNALTAQFGHFETDQSALPSVIQSLESFPVSSNQ